MLEIKNFSKSYSNNSKAVDNISLNVDDGEIFGFIGHNGAGKTTTIKCVCGILRFTDGDILLDGTSIKKDAYKCKLNMSYMPDNPDLYESLTAIEYLNFIGDMYEMPSDVRLKQIQHLAKELDMESHLGDTISSFSHGMKQKIVLISSFMHSPRLIVMDEPFVGLDPAASYTLKKMMREHCNNGNSIFFSTHVLEVAEKLCDSVGIMNHGQLILSGKTKELVNNQSLEEVFMSTLNMEESTNAEESVESSETI